MTIFVGYWFLFIFSYFVTVIYLVFLRSGFNFEYIFRKVRTDINITHLNVFCHLQISDKLILRVGNQRELFPIDKMLHF